MTEGQFIDAVLEHLFMRGLNCLNLPLLLMYARMDQDRHGAWPDPSAFADQCTQLPGVSHRPVEQTTGAVPSVTAGAREKWLAVHEAGHAIVGFDAGFALRGIRFYGNDGFPGEAGLEALEWKTSKDENLLRRLIRVDVAGNMAEILHPDCPAPQGRLSVLYDDRTPGNRPTDFISADSRARHLAVVLRERDGKGPDVEAVWKARREIVEQAEAEAQQVLAKRQKVLDRLADQLLQGPMPGSAVRSILER
jgi:hypothetical protein